VFYHERACLRKLASVALGLKPASFIGVLIAALKALRHPKSMWIGSSAPPEGAIDNSESAVCLKAYPDTNLTVAGSTAPLAGMNLTCAG
jgi:hypothetical protein